MKDKYTQVYEYDTSRKDFYSKYIKVYYEDFLDTKEIERIKKVEKRNRIINQILDGE
jgi:hypothetical protein